MLLFHTYYPAPPYTHPAPQDYSCLTPHHPFALPNLLLSPAISGLSCCTFSTITPKGPQWWQIPKSGHTAQFPRLWNCVTHQREKVPCLIQNGTCSLLGVPSLLTQRSRSSIPWSKAIASTASLACVYGALAGFWPQLHHSRSGNVPGAWASHHPILASLLSLVAISSHMQGNCGGGCPWERGEDLTTSSKSASFLLGSYPPPSQNPAVAPHCLSLNLNFSLWGLKSLRNYIPPSHISTPTHISCLTQGQT